MTHPRWSHRIPLPVLFLGILSMLRAAAAPAAERTVPGSQAPEQESQPIQPPPALGGARIVAASLPPEPAAGKGRLTLALSGDHLWCTNPDDRLIKPPEDPRKSDRDQRRTEVFTFGYQFTIAAIKRGAPQRPIMLFESPMIRTASLRPAFKLGIPPPSRKGMVGPSVGMTPRGGVRGSGTDPESPVPYWDDQNRCVTLPERFDFDLEPGTYDIYAAFDVMSREGAWVHRTSDYLTDVPVEAKRHTSLQGTASMSGPSGRELSLQSASLQPAGAGTEPTGP